MGNPQDYVILVDQDDNEIGVCEKMDAHVDGKLHRAFSIFIYNSNGEILLQQRAADKYHSGKLWTNSCCSHPAPHETIAEAARRRLMEELMIQTPLRQLFRFYYHAVFENGLVEHELDHVLVGKYESIPMINEQEAIAYKWVSLQEIKQMIANQPEEYTYWFKHIIAFHFEELEKSIHEDL